MLRLRKIRAVVPSFFGKILLDTYGENYLLFESVLRVGLMFCLYHLCQQQETSLYHIFCSIMVDVMELSSPVIGIDAWWGPRISPSLRGIRGALAKPTDVIPDS